MNCSLKAATGLLLWAAVCFPAASQSPGVPSIRSVQVLRSAGQAEIEIEASDRIIPRTNVLTAPDRLVVDFVNAVPGAQLRNQSVNRGEVKSVRTGLFSANPPVTRIVVDLNGPQAYQVFPSGRMVIVKIGGGAAVQASAARPGSRLSLMNTNYPTQAVQISPPARLVAKPPLEVSYENGLLSVNSRKASLSEVLFAIHQRTGAEIAIPAGAEQEQVVVELGPAPATEVLAGLLNGSKFNFLILNSTIDPRAVDRVILSSRPEGPMPPPPQRSRAEIEREAEVEAETEAQPKGGPTPARAEPKQNSTSDHTDPTEETPKTPKVAGDTDIPD